MRAYKVSCTVADGDDDVDHFIYAGTGADAKFRQKDYMAQHGVGKDDVKIEEVDIPTAKDGLLAFVNNLIR